ncbi:hypothetical protein ABEB36_010684 [Hypothenemus hampei]|uniref:Uncharacterized protein n=1 Tax=Hypothenemus hampei TaxID=57062 RepID=A0ABD1ECQ4_HYPHA
MTSEFLIPDKTQVPIGGSGKIPSRVKDRSRHHRDPIIHNTYKKELFPIRGDIEKYPARRARSESGTHSVAKLVNTLSTITPLDERSSSMADTTVRLGSISIDKTSNVEYKAEYKICDCGEVYPKVLVVNLDFTEVIYLLQTYNTTPSNINIDNIDCETINLEELTNNICKHFGISEINYHSALQQLRIEDPQSREYVILGKTAEEIIDERGSSSFDFEELKRNFRRICEDYESDVISGQRYKALDFCSKMLYEVGPESRQVKKNTGDKTWKFLFIYKINDKEVRIKTAFVSTFKEDNSVYTQESSSTKIVLTVRHASLLALLTLDRINMIAIAMTPPKPLLTPLAGAVFSKDDIEGLASMLKATPLSVLCAINSSCQSGGQY